MFDSKIETGLSLQLKCGLNRFYGILLDNRLRTYSVVRVGSSVIMQRQAGSSGCRQLEGLLAHHLCHVLTIRRDNVSLLGRHSRLKQDVLRVVRSKVGTTTLYQNQLLRISPDDHDRHHSPTTFRNPDIHGNKNITPKNGWELGIMYASLG